MAEENNHKRRKFLFNPLTRPLPYVGLIIAILLIVFHQAIRNYTSETIGDILVNSIKEATGGVYKTSYDVVRFDIISRELRIINLNIALDTTVISKEDYLKTRPNLVDVNTPIVVIKLRSILPLLLNNQLFISYIGAREPRFNLVKSLYSSVKKGAKNNNKNDFIEVFNTYFTALEIDSFRIEKGGFSFSTHAENEEEIKLIHVGEFTTMLKGFRLDSLSPAILFKGIKAKSFELEVINQEVNLPKINQSIYFSRLHVSTIDSTFVLDSLRVKNIRQNTGKSNLNLAVKKLKILGFDFEKTFSENSIEVNEIHIIEPALKFKKLRFSKIKTKEKTPQEDLYSYFNQLNVKSINIYDGSFDYEGKRLSKIDNFNLKIANYSINQEDWGTNKPISGFKLVDLEASNIWQELPDSIHIAKIKSIKYSGNNKRLVLSNLKINPLPKRKSYKLLAKRNTNFIATSTIKTITLTDFIPEDLVLNNNLKIDSLVIESPKSSAIQYPKMRIKKNAPNIKRSFKFSISHFITNNGSLRLRQYQNKTNSLTTLSGIYINSSSISEKTKADNLPQRFKLRINNGNSQLKNMGHNAAFSGVRIDQTKSVYIKQVSLKPDSTTLPYHQINAQANNVLLEGIGLNELQAQNLILDSVLIGKLTLNADLTRANFIKNKKGKSSLKSVLINNFILADATINSKQGNTVVNIKEGNLALNNILIDSLNIEATPIINFNNAILSFSGANFENKKEGLKLSSQSGHFNEADSTFILKNIQYLSPDKGNKISLKALKIAGFDKDKFIQHNALHISKIELINPLVILASKAKRDSSSSSFNLDQRILKKGLSRINLDTLQIINGQSIINLPNNRELELSSFKGIVTNYMIDTTTTIFSAINNFKGVFDLNNIYLKGLTDTLTIAKIHLDTYRNFIWTDSIHFNAQLAKNNLAIASPGIAIDHIDIPKLLRKKIAVSRISTRNNVVRLTQTDSTKNTHPIKIPKILIPLDIEITDINFINTHFKYRKLHQKKHLLRYLNFDIKLDSLNAEEGRFFDIVKHTSDARFRAYDFSFNLPDSLNTIGFDTLLVSSKKSKIELTNVTLTARYPKYEYANQVGYQVDWKDLLLKKIHVKNIDFVELIENKTLLCNKITLDEGHLKLFKDKQLPFPSNRVVPLLQERVKGIELSLKIDSIEIKSFDIHQSTLQSTGLQEGGITFINTNGLITNITNDSLRLSNNRMLEVIATSSIMGSGNLFAEFKFDMLDKDNLFFFDAKLGPMDAKAFNNILEAAAFVKIKSGDIRSLNLQATGNKKYAYGGMSFIYSNLKVETINKKTLENKGMGKVIKTFFANAFVVKKNNSRIKFISRRGGMYYERDISRITLDYMAKTAISGVVSSIGAKSNNKQIKQITKDNKEARDLEMKREKELKKAAKKKAKKE